jgi:4-hydroxyphenylpyruvate dioxygenase-like putative hemolysin
VNYDDPGIQAVALEAADAVVAAEEAQATSAPAAAFATSVQDSKERTTLAKDCVQQSGIQGQQDVLIRLIEAEFEGTPAYIAVFSEGPGAGQPPDHIVVFVVAKDDCRILSTASQRITPG